MASFEDSGRDLDDFLDELYDFLQGLTDRVEIIEDELGIYSDDEDEGRSRGSGVGAGGRGSGVGAGGRGSGVGAGGRGSGMGAGGRGYREAHHDNSPNLRERIAYLEDAVMGIHEAITAVSNGDS